MPIISTAAGGLFYARRGAAGPPLVCVHGAGGTWSHWGYQLRDLAGSAQLYALDLPGHGRSAPPGRATVAEYGAALLAFLDACSLEQVVLAGHSMGGAIALWTALEFPERVSGLALVGAAARLRVGPAILQGLQSNYAATVGLMVDRSYAPEAPAELRARAQAAYAQCDPLVCRNDFAACDRFDMLARLPELRCPVGIICGAADRMVPLAHSAELARQIPAATLTAVTGAGHMPMIEQPAAVAAALRELLARGGNSTKKAAPSSEPPAKQSASLHRDLAGK